MRRSSLLAIVLLSVSTALAQVPPPMAVHNTSVYSTLDEKLCKTLKTSEEGSSSEQLCPGVASYKLRVSDDDARQSLTVVTPAGQLHPLRFSEVVTDHFSSLGPRAEWRMQATPAGAVPVALTVRLNANDDTGNPARTTSYLVISRIDPQQICVVKVLKSSASALDDARLVADRAAGLACLKP